MDFAAEAEIVAIDPFGLLAMALIQKQGRQRMTWRMHPCPRFGVGQVVVKLDGLPQIGIGLVMAALMIGKLAIEKCGTDSKRGAGRVAEKTPLRRHTFHKPMDLA